MNPNFKDVGEKFVEAYYQLFDTNRAQLANFYVSFFLCYILQCICILARTELLITVTSKLSLRVFSGCLNSVFILRFMSRNLTFTAKRVATAFSFRQSIL